MGRLITFWTYVRTHAWVKYAAATLLFALIIGVLDENSLLVRFQRQGDIANLRQEIARYQAQYEAETAQLEALRTDQQAVERLAREKYLMKRPDEDLYVFAKVDPAQIQSSRRAAASPAPRPLAVDTPAVATMAADSAQANETTVNE